MTKLSLYARVALLTPLLCLPVAAAEQGAQPACATCVAVALQPGATLVLPDLLHGLTVLIRAPQNMTREAVAAVEHIRERGGRPGLLVSHAALPPGASPLDLKVHLTELRGRVGRDVVIALEEPAPTGGHLADVASYADVLVSRAESRARREGARVWLLSPATTPDAALAATTAGGIEQWVVMAPDDVVDARELLRRLAAAAAPPPDAFTEGVEVRAARALTAAEIVARHQAMARRQAAHVSRVISTGVMTLTFEAPGFPAPIAITSDTVVYQGGGRTEMEQRALRVNGIEFTGRGIPRLPIIEPERVATPPLTITLSDVYRYRLSGEEGANGVRSYVIDFEPANRGAVLFSGRAWIAVDSFAVVRVAATQTGLRGAIVSSEQVDDFREVQPGIWLIDRSQVRQLYEGAAHRTPIQRVLSIESHEINPADFDQRLAAAYASPSVMLRDTAEGFRYLTREPGRAGTPAAGTVVVDVAPRSDRVRTLAAGLIIDPNINIPLPFAGVSYVDFDLFETGAQLNAFFGGSYGQLAFSAPSVAGTRWQLAGRAFGILSSYNDRAFRAGREIYAENIRQRPAHASVWLLRPLTTRVSVRAGYELDYTRLRRAPETDPQFIVPADQVVHGLRLGVDAQRGGWAASLWWNPATRAGWRPWGRPDAFSPEDRYEPAHATFQRAGASVSRSLVISPRLVTRLEAAAMGGRDLDRFSRYTFGTFDNRLRGYPSALVRYDQGGVLRSAVAWSATRLARFDGFVDTALVRDRGFGSGYRNYTGVGAALEAPAPFGVLASVEWGYGFRGVNANGRPGTHVIRISAFKVF